MIYLPPPSEINSVSFPNTAALVLNEMNLEPCIEVGRRRLVIGESLAMDHSIPSARKVGP